VFSVFAVTLDPPDRRPLTERSQGGGRYGSAVKLGVVGELLVDLNGATVELRRAERRLVAGLAVERPSGVRYDALAEAVWGDRVPASAKHSLQSHVRRIRAVTGHGLVQTVAGGYRLGTDVQVDVDAFESAIERAGAADDEAPRLWAEALSWWRGPPFVDLDDWAPAVAERARLTELWNRAVEECCAACLATSDPTTVIAEAERLVHAEPLRERRWALLMTALAAAGRRPEALRTFDRARRALATELGISPGAELAQLHAALVRDDVETIAAVHRVFAHNLPIQLTPLIGRASEIADVLGQLVEERLVTLTGSAGVGKTRLALAAAAAASATYSGGVWLVELAPPPIRPTWSLSWRRRCGSRPVPACRCGRRS
jgi:DNA-binding SARP family transcriptional activator